MKRTNDPTRDREQLTDPHDHDLDREPISNPSPYESDASGQGQPELADSETAMRFDLSVIASWIEPGSKVLDLGCGEGDLLHHLKQTKHVEGTGIEMVEAKVLRGIEKGLTVLQGNITEEVQDYAAGTFDYVILSQTLQQVYAPAQLLKTLLDIGHQVVVSFPNFSHWKNRWQICWHGRVPISKQLPFEWYNTPNIRTISIADFQRFLKKMGWRIKRETAINTDHHDRYGNVVTFLPNLRATYGIYLLAKR